MAGRNFNWHLSLSNHSKLIAHELVIHDHKLEYWSATNSSGVNSSYHLGSFDLTQPFQVPPHNPIMNTG